MNEEGEKRLKDPIYGYISVPLVYMRNIVDTPVFQRLRRIMQTSYSPLYSSAVHNRFVHSLGVYHLGRIAGKQLSQEICQFMNTSEVQEKTERFQQVFELACLLHDVGHAPFSHTGEEFYLRDGHYDELHKLLKETVSSETFSCDVPESENRAAAPHEIMSAIIGIKSFPELYKSPEDRELFARCITGYSYSGNTMLEELKNCYIFLLNSKVIDVDKMDYLIRDAYITGFNTVRLDYERLLRAITVYEKNGRIKLAYYKDALSVVENVVYAHDAEKKWIQNHPVVLYEIYVLNHIFSMLQSKLDNHLFSYETLTEEGYTFENGKKLSLVCDDDIIYLMKNIYPSDIGKEFFDRRKRRHAVWKSEAEYLALFNKAVGKDSDSMKQIELAMKNTVSYLSKTADTWKIDTDTYDKLKSEIEAIDQQDLDQETRHAQLEQKEIVKRFMKCLIDYAERNGFESDFVILEASQFSSGFGKPDFSDISIIFRTKDGYLDSRFQDVAGSFRVNDPDKKKYYYLFYRRKEETDEALDKAEICNSLIKEFAGIKTYKRN